MGTNIGFNSAITKEGSGGGGGKDQTNSLEGEEGRTVCRLTRKNDV